MFKNNIRCIKLQFVSWEILVGSSILCLRFLRL